MGLPRRRPPLLATLADLRRARTLLDISIAEAQAAADSAGSDAAGAQATADAALAAVAGLEVMHNELPDLQGGTVDEYYHLSHVDQSLIESLATGLRTALGAADVQAFCAAIGAPYVVGRQTTQLTCPNNTSENVLLAMPVPALPASGLLEVLSIWGTNANTNTKRVRVYHNTAASAGGTLLCTLDNTAAAARTISDLRMLWNQASVSSQRYHAAATVFNANLQTATATAALNTGSATYLVFTAQKVTASADTITLDLALARLF